MLNGGDGAARRDLIVIRVIKDGNIAMAKPCKNCLARLLREPLLRHVYYSTSSGYITRELVTDMHTTHLSNYDRTRIGLRDENY